MTSVELILPRLSDTMVEGTVARWLKNAGDRVAKGEEIVEVDTDKVTVALEAPADGFLAQPRVAEGASVAVGSVLAAITEDPSAIAGDGDAGPGAVAAVESTPPRAAADSGGAPALGAADARATVVPATPLARKRARSAGIELRRVYPGSGPGGRILRQDVDRAARAAASADTASATQDIPPSHAQAAVARRMTESKREVPHYYVTAEVDVTDAIALIESARSLESPLRLTMTHLAVQSCALSLAAMPEVNSSWIDGKLVRHRDVNVGIAVSRENGDLLVPVLKRADSMSLVKIVERVHELVGAARRGRLAAEAAGDGTFTVSNLAGFGVDEFHAIINPPESGILALGEAKQRATVTDRAIVPRAIMRVSLSADHRVYSGVAAARFLNSIRRRLEKPMSLFLANIANDAT